MRNAPHENLLIKKAVPSQSITGSTVNGTGIDCRGAEEVLFVVNAGAIGTGAYIDCKIQESSDNGATDTFSDISGAAITRLADTDDNSVATIRVQLHGNADVERYLRAVVTGGGSAAVLVGVEAILCGLDVPVTQDVTPISV